MIPSDPEWRELDEGEQQQSKGIEPMRVFQENFVVEVGYYCVGAQSHEDPNDLANPVIALLIVLGTVDKEYADDR